ncbi:MAG: hypothetical protein Q9197_001015 [Variospora fuerteventurae]
MIGTKLPVSATFAFLVLLSTIQAQNPGSCPQDNGKYRKTSAGEGPTAPDVPVLGNIGSAWFHNARLADPPAPLPGAEPQKPIIAPDPSVNPDHNNPDQNIKVTDDPQCTQDDGMAYVSGDGK